jgi:NUMOD4 motif
MVLGWKIGLKQSKHRGPGRWDGEPMMRETWQRSYLGETWRPVAGWPYEVSNLCRVRRCAHTIERANGRTYRVRARVLHPYRHCGRERVTLSRPGDRRIAYAAALAREAGFEPPVARLTSAPEAGRVVRITK